MSKRLTAEYLLKNGSVLPNTTASHVYKIDNTTVDKVGGIERLSEAKTMEFLSSRTSIPIPRVYDAYIDEQDPRKAHLVMQYIQGDVLRDVWDGMSSSQKEGIVTQLKGYLNELRTIKGTRIGPVDRTPCVDPFFEMGDLNRRYGPYEDETAFNEGIVNALFADGQDAFRNMVADMVRTMSGHEIVFTHADVSPRNIIVRNAEIVAILDWELSGFYPEYWEYIKALYLPDWEASWIKDRVADQILEPYHVEHAIMRQVRDVFW